METALHIGLENVAVAAVIAVVAWVASFARGRPALAHALWLVVLLKLLTPPLWGVSVEGIFGSRAHVASASEHGPKGWVAAAVESPAEVDVEREDASTPTASPSADESAVEWSVVTPPPTPAR